MALSSWIRSWKRSVERRWALYQVFRRKTVARCQAARPRLEALEERWLLSAYTVTSAADDGSAGTLRYAINQANATGSTITEIDFNIGTPGSAQTISLTSQLPALTANGVFINGLSQGGSGNTTQLITLDGTKAGTGSDGLLLQGSKDIVSGLIIEDFKNGIEVDGANDIIGGTATGAGNLISGNSNDGVLIDNDVSGVLVQGNYIGTNAAGSAALANSVGVEVSGNNTTIGGTTSGARNILSGNSVGGVLITDEASGVAVQGNYIGTDVTGAKAIANGDGIDMDGSNNDTIGGIATGTGNIISGNNGVGLNIGSSGVLVQGNYIGTDVTGTNDLANQFGILLGGSKNTIGGTTSGARNVVSGNTVDGVLILDFASSEAVQGNDIGTDVTGAKAIGNGSGIMVESSNNTIGGTTSGARNVISGNSSDGVLLNGSANQVLGNSIGTNAAGTAALANGDTAELAIGTGIYINGNSNTVGGSASGAGNLISGNNGDGVLIQGSANQVLGNSIGTNAAGNAALANLTGIGILGSSNTVGGSASGAGNLISGNSFGGVQISESGNSNLVLGNSIGTKVAGNEALANVGSGLAIYSSNNTVGGTTPGSGNLISGNSSDGVHIGNGTGNLVLGNSIGTNVAGNAALPNAGGGIDIDFSNNTVGGSAPGAGNLISGNGTEGVFIGDNGTGNLVLGNSIGTNIAGNAALPNAGTGIYIAGGSNDNTIGGTAFGARNLISGNSGDGVLIAYASGNLVLGNYIGTDAVGNAALPNSIGIYVRGLSSNTIGGTASGAGNLISGNSSDGVQFDDNADSMQVLGNFIGTNAAGNAAVPNSIGIDILLGSNNTIGGTASGARNLISGNSNDGVQIGSSSNGNQVMGNDIGTNVSGTALGNGGYGVSIAGSNNLIGGSVASAGNIIADNTQGGVLVSIGSGNTIRLNSIFANGSTHTGPGITLTSGANNNLAAPALHAATFNGGTLTVRGSFTAPTANVSYVLDFYANPTGDAEGKIYLGSLTVTPTRTGNIPFTFTTTTTATATNPLVTATLTDASGDTSSFSNGVTVKGPPPPPPPPQSPVLNVPPLLAFLNSMVGGGIETVSHNGSETITDYLFSIPLLVSTFNSSGQLMSASVLGIDITFLFG